ncbi:MAG: metallophosphoesterase family protein [Bacillota bacterium]
MKIAVISDTHFRDNEKWLPPEVVNDLREADLIVHCGDFEAYSAYRRMLELGQLVAVYGNMDTSGVKEALPDLVVFEAAGHKIGVTHGSGAPSGIEDRVAAQFREKVDIILFGHSHQPRNEYINGVLFFNPGSPTDRIFAPYNSYGIIELTDSGINAEIIRLDK